MTKRDNKPYAAVSLVAANILVFLWLTVTGSTLDSRFMIEHGTMVPVLVLEEKEYYRVITAFFLHFGFSHLLNNMILLGYLGAKLEENIGHLRFAVIYLAAGILGNVVSLFFYAKSEPWVSCAGASGAVFGVTGAFLCLAVRHRGKLEGITVRRLLLMILFTLYNGYVDSGVNNTAHLAGLITGILLGMLLTGRSARTKEAE